ncbi:MAG: aggregation factor core [Pseudomonadota bacterium]
MKHLTCLAVLAATPAFAGLQADFIEGAPKDRFSFTNVSACDLGPVTIKLDLAGSAAGLIFDTSGAGAGVEVFQPYQTVAGADRLAKASPVSDGDTEITLTLTGLPPNASVAFTIDVDDTRPQSALGQIRVDDSEIAGAMVILTSGGMLQSGVFDTTSRAHIKTAQCVS